jgi:hypothetical protein
VSRFAWVVVVLGAASLGFIGGSCAGVVRYGFLGGGTTADHPELVEYAPLPHHVPKAAGAVSFRFAMVHDVIHERFARHGPAYHRERNRVAREKMKGLRPDVQSAFLLTDDLAAGLARLGKYDEAVTVMRDKLARQRASGNDGGSLYTSYANLGTFLLHDNFEKAASGDEDAKARFREGVDFIRRAVEVNPQAHFGREQWQAAFAEFLLAAMDDPSLLKKFDLLGNRLAWGIEELLNRRATDWKGTEYGRPYSSGFSRGNVQYAVPAFLRPGAVDDPAQWQEVSRIRQYVTKVGAEEGWDDVDVSSHCVPVAFDEPCLSIVGMWRQGAGANPHFALALAETMLRVGQRYVAWSAYERASRLAEQFWPDDEMRRFLRDHCLKRQTQIEQTLTHPAPGARRQAWQHVSPRPPDGTVEKLRPAFEEELAYGEAYQKAYQKYEEEKIAAGGSVLDAKFFDDFFEGREPIASPSGPEEAYPYVPHEKLARWQRAQMLACGVFGAGLAALLASAVCWWFAGSKREAKLPGQVT